MGLKCGFGVHWRGFWVKWKRFGIRPNWCECWVFSNNMSWALGELGFWAHPRCLVQWGVRRRSIWLICN